MRWARDGRRVIEESRKQGHRLGVSRSLTKPPGGATAHFGIRIRQGFFKYASVPPVSINKDQRHQIVGLLSACGSVNRRDENVLGSHVDVVDAI